MDIKTEIREFIAENFLPDQSSANLDDAMPLITSGIVDSLGMLSLVDFLESRFEIEFMPREIDARSLDTLAQIEVLVHRKRSMVGTTGD